MTAFNSFYFLTDVRIFVINVMMGVLGTAL